MYYAQGIWWASVVKEIDSAIAGRRSFSLLGVTALLLTLTACAGGGGISTPPQGADPLAPTAVTVTAGHAEVTISWMAVAGATSYNIYRSTMAGAQGSKIGASSTTSYTDTSGVSGTTYYYEVTADNSAGQGSPSTQSTGVTPELIVTAPSAPTGVTATAGNAQVTIAWVAVTAATSYNIYRSTIQASQGTKVGSSATTSYIDPTALNGTAYYYEVTAVNSSGESAASTQSAAATPEVPVNVPAAPTGVNATPGNAQVTVSWTASIGATSYNIYRSTTLGSQGTKIGSLASTIYTDTSAVNGTTYYYEVTALDAGGEGPASSQTAGATPSTSTLTVLHSFGGGSDGVNQAPSPFDGILPFPFAGGGLIQAADGNFYGVTFFGGADNLGAVFKITPAGVETLLYSFAGGVTVGPDGAHPSAGLIQGSDGNLYGTTSNGGTNGTGTVFKVTSAGAETVVYSFPANFANPSGLVQGKDGNFYGTMGGIGGTGNHGLVFKVTPAGVGTILYSFAGGTDGSAPNALIVGSDGNFYGTTTDGGANDKGTVFEVTPAGTETILYSFMGNSDGAFPYTLIQGRDGNFYGITTSPIYDSPNPLVCTVFKLTVGGVKTILYSFIGASNNDADGFDPGSLIQGADGNFYGTTFLGGAYGGGAFFEVTSAGVETVQYSFSGTSYPLGVIEGSNGYFYGVTAVGGQLGEGSVFEIN